MTDRLHLENEIAIMSALIEIAHVVEYGTHVSGETIAKLRERMQESERQVEDFAARKITRDKFVKACDTGFLRGFWANTDAQRLAAVQNYWEAKTPEEERIAYARMRELGLPASYDESN